MAGYTTGIANPNLQQLANISPEFSGDAQDLARSQRLAQMLTSAPVAEGQMVSGRYVAPSWTQNLAQLVNAGAGAYYQNQAEEQQTKLAEKLRQDKMGTLEAINTAINAGDLNKARAIATAKPEYGKEFIAPLLANTIPKTPDSVLKYKFAQTPEGGNFKGSLTEFENQMTPYQKEQLAIERQKLANEAGGGKLSEFQGKATNFGVQMAGSVNEMAAVEKAGFDPATTKNQALLSLAGTKFGNTVVSPEVQRYKQSMDNFTESFIRFKSGANVPMKEIEKDLKNLMPEVGDSQDKLNQKQRARERALQGMSISAGPGARFIKQAYEQEAPPMLNQSNAPAKPASNAQATPSLWGPATVVTK